MQILRLIIVLSTPNQCNNRKILHEYIFSLLTVKDVTLRLLYVEFLHNKSKSRALIGQLATTICPWVHAKKLS